MIYECTIKKNPGGFGLYQRGEVRCPRCRCYTVAANGVCGICKDHDDLADRRLQSYQDAMQKPSGPGDHPW